MQTIEKKFNSTQQKILKIFITQKKKIMLKLDLKLCIKQNMEQDLKYYFLNKCFKDYQ